MREIKRSIIFNWSKAIIYEKNVDPEDIESQQN